MPILQGFQQQRGLCLTTISTGALNRRDALVNISRPIAEKDTMRLREFCGSQSCFVVPFGSLGSICTGHPASTVVKNQVLPQDAFRGTARLAGDRACDIGYAIAGPDRREWSSRDWFSVRQVACALSRTPNAPTIFITVSKLGLPSLAIALYSPWRDMPVSLASFDTPPRARATTPSACTSGSTTSTGRDPGEAHCGVSGFVIRDDNAVEWVGVDEIDAAMTLPASAR
jgi:hypothetical protein